ncbi:hypothetical protein ACFQ1S_19555, partial [Kibdelosporangium lantanae]
AGQKAWDDAAAAGGLDKDALARAYAVKKESMWQVFINAAGEVVKSLIGWDDIKACVTEGNIGSCAMTVATLIPWGKVLKAGEIIASFWKGARALITFGKDVEKAEKVIADSERVIADADRAAKEAEEAVAAEERQAAHEAEQAASDAKSSGTSDSSSLKREVDSPGNEFAPPHKSYGPDLPRTKASVRAVAQKYGIPLDFKWKVDVNNSIIDEFGETTEHQVVHFYGPAFYNEEEMARTIAHERRHVVQLRDQGMLHPKLGGDRSAFEQAAYAFEEGFWNTVRHLR